ncbi:hypothetical protein [Streptomyces sp. SP17KL33]|uniref:hypothetical protein n=1 Tax=Streptomyces sp. SP17KL33 TaxID=3002534 RepID=UPI002E75DBC0|nr:hypothetical protein [Streptomyces sp. SP17KL33]MEE1831743.1 hypothetical protein [Streptomyces sp. SP17KL33]
MSDFPSDRDPDGESEFPLYGSEEESGVQFTTPSSTAKDLNALRGIEYVMPPALEAFINLYSRPHLRYAHAMLGDKLAAIAVVAYLSRRLIDLGCDLLLLSCTEWYVCISGEAYAGPRRWRWAMRGLSWPFCSAQ